MYSKKYSKAWIKSKDRNNPDTKIPNLIKSILTENQLSKPNQIWCTDFTYLKFHGVRLYLSTFIDGFTKEITGVHLSTKHDTNMVLTTLNQAIQYYGEPEIIHSDQGSEYTSFEFQNTLGEYNIQSSNSAKGSPWQNGIQESFYGKFKTELELDQLPRTASYLDIYNHIINQVDYYNNYRIHSSIENIPSEYRANFVPKSAPTECRNSRNYNLKLQDLEENLVS